VPGLHVQAFRRPQDMIHGEDFAVRRELVLQLFRVSGLAKKA
jgi:hypothetical protein